MMGKWEPNWVTAKLIALVAVSLSIFQMWQPIAGFIPAGAIPFEDIFGMQPAVYFRPVHLLFILVLGLFLYPVRGGPFFKAIDVALVCLAIWATYRVLIFDYQGIEHLLYGLQISDFLAGFILLLVTLEVARRSVGPTMAIIGLFFILYGLFGYLLPDAIASRDLSMERILRFQIFTNAGLFGVPLGIAAGAVFSFVLFGAFLQVTGAGKTLIDLAFAIAGRSIGGPAKASVIASAAMGSISGSAIANTVTTGSMTIPMMKELGYSPEQAAGTEAAASTGGQIMPPIMGAGAFVMAEFTKTSYGEIVWISLVPAILYFISVLMYVHLAAVKGRLSVAGNRTAVLPVLKNGLHFFLPISLITWLLLENYSPVLVGMSGCCAILLATFLQKDGRINPVQVLEGLKQGAILAVPISAACAVAGIVVGTIGQTGIGLQFTESVVAMSGGQLWFALVLIAFAALVLGMGLPATAAYIVLAVMTGPALQDLGLPLIAAHMIIFWLAQTSNVTPPIALAAFAGAGIAGASPMKSAFSAFKLANGLFLIPLMMAYSTLLLVDGNSWSDVLLSAVCTLTILVLVAIALEGYWNRAFTKFQRVLAAGLALALVWPSFYSRIIGALGCIIYVIALRRHFLRAGIAAQYKDG